MNCYTWFHTNVGLAFTARYFQFAVVFAFACHLSTAMLSPTAVRGAGRALSAQFRSLATPSKLMMSSQINHNDVTRRNILALDFDGVVCASSVESSFSSIVAAESFWPETCKIIKAKDPKSTYSTIDLEDKSSLFCKIRLAVNELRPIVETGFENMLLVRAIFEEYQQTGEISAPKLLAKWSPTYRDELLSKYGTNKEELVAYFGKIRDDLIAEDVKAWVGLNQVYPCISSCLSNISPKKLNFTIITTKQERFVTAILETNKITPPEKENIYDLENPYGAKTKVLEALIAKYNEQDEIKEYIAIKGVKIHFVEDRYETLLAVMKIPELDDVQLYLVDWGYNTEIQRNQAKELSPRIKLINGEEFQDLASQFII